MDGFNPVRGMDVGESMCRKIDSIMESFTPGNSRSSGKVSQTFQFRQKYSVHEGGRHNDKYDYHDCGSTWFVLVSVTAV